MKLVKCVEPTKYFTFGKKYEGEQESGNCYIIRNDEGCITKVLKTRFERVNDMLNGKFVIVSYGTNRYDFKTKEILRLLLL